MAELELNMSADEEEIFERVCIVLSDYSGVVLECYKKSRKVILRIIND